MSEPAKMSLSNAPVRAPWWRRPGVLFALILTATVAFQVAYVLTSPLDLQGDVAHVWMWSRRPDISYYSKPPLIAYLVRLATWIGGHRAEAIRLMAVALGLATIAATYGLARRMFDGWVALAAVLAMSAAPIFSAGSIVLTTDAPMFLCWALTAAFTYVALFEEKRWAWYAAGAALLAGVLSKLTMLLFVPSAAFYLVFAAGEQRRRAVRCPAMWAGLAIGLAGLSPVVLWNALRGWPMLDHLLSNNAGVGRPWAGWAGVGVFFGSQLLVLNPLLFGMYVAGMVAGIRRAVGRVDRRYGLLACLSLPVMGFYLLLSVKTKPLANWPAPAYFTGLIAAAAVFVEWVRAERRRGRKAAQVFGAVTLAFGLLIMGVFRYSEQLLYPPLAWANAHWGWTVEPSNVDPSFKLHGFQELAAKADALAETWRSEAAAEGRPFFIFSDDRQLAGELSFYMAGHPMVFRGYNQDEEDDQYRYWPGPHDDPALEGAEAMYVCGTDRAEEFVHCFEQLESIGEQGQRPGYYALQIERGGLPVRRFHIRRFRGYNGEVLQWRPGPATRPAGGGAAP